MRITTDLGAFDIALLDTLTPMTAENFLGYVERDDYVNSFIHRSVANFVIQGGGFAVGEGQIQRITTQDPVVNEPLISNVRRTVAMAKIGGDPDSATSQWFVSLNDNSENLDDQNGGFTVFATVLGNGMTVVDAIAALPRVDLNVSPGLTLEDLPLDDNYDPSQGGVGGNNLVSVTSVEVVPSPAAVEVPSLLGLSESRALQDAVLAGLLLGDVSGRPATPVANCNVVSQGLSANAAAAPGTGVGVTLGGVVPNLADTSRASAERSIQAAGLTVGNVTISEPGLNYRVQQQSVAPETVLGCGTRIDLLIAPRAPVGAVVPILLEELLSD